MNVFSIVLFLGFLPFVVGCLEVTSNTVKLIPHFLLILLLQLSPDLFHHTLPDFGKDTRACYFTDGLCISQSVPSMKCCLSFSLIVISGCPCLALSYLSLASNTCCFLSITFVASSSLIERASSSILWSNRCLIRTLSTASLFSSDYLAMARCYSCTWRVRCITNLLLLEACCL